MKNDPTLPDRDQLLLGCFPERFDANSSKQGIGFGHVASIAAENRPWLQLPADRHITTIAPTGSGKGRGLIIPNLLHYRGSALVVDIKGELAQVTARYRREVLEQKVFVLDPFGRSRLERATLNPLDVLLLQPDDQEAVADIRASGLITAIKAGHDSTADGSQPRATLRGYVFPCSPFCPPPGNRYEIPLPHCYHR